LNVLNASLNKTHLTSTQHTSLVALGREYANIIYHMGFAK
jgi:hypothetical protein